MADTSKITKALKKIRETDDERSKEIVLRYFWAEARRYAKRHLSTQVRKIEPGTAVANAALNSAFKATQKKDANFSGRDEFEALLFDIINKKAKSAGRKSTAKKRDTRRETELSKADDGEASLAVANQAVAADLVKEIARILLDEPTEVQRTINLLSYYGGLSAPAIHDVLVATIGRGGKIPERRAIQLHIAAVHKRLDLFLRKRYGK